MGKLEIANRFMIGQTIEEIADGMDMAPNLVRYTLAEDTVQDYLAKSSNNKETQMHLRRISRADGIMDTLLDRIEEFIKDQDFTVDRWKDSHVSLIKDVLLNKLPTAINKAIGTAININIGSTTANTQTDSALMDLVKELDPNDVLLFWSLIQSIAEHIKAGRTTVITELTSVLESFNITNHN